ncbi:MAG: NifU family protein [Candidatus Gastranaerophilales bacterium]|nr:NifU family protein [Candidatus Gastranaerophilales bacterium]
MAKSQDSCDRTVCQCYGITEKKLRQLIREHKIKDIYEAAAVSKVGSACGKCKEDVQAIIDDENTEKQESVPLTQTQLIIKVNSLIEGYISDQLRKDDGDIQLIEVEGNKVFVKLKGTCSNCAMSSLTLKNFVEKVLREQVSPDIEVIAV